MRNRKTIAVKVNNYLNRLGAYNLKEYGNGKLTLERYSIIRINDTRRAYK